MSILSPAEREALARPVREQQEKYRRIIRWLVITALVASNAVSILLAVRYAESRDNRDISTCLAEYTARVGDARDGRQTAIFDGLVSLALDGDLVSIASRKPDIDKRIARAEQRRDVALEQAQNNPAAFLRRCRQ